MFLFCKKSDLQSNKEINFVCDINGNNTRSFEVKIVLIYNNDHVNGIYSGITSESYFTSTIDTENQDSVTCKSYEIIPGTVVSKKIQIDSGKDLKNCWVFCDLHQKAAGTIVKKLQIGRFRKCQVNFFKDATEVINLEN